MCIVSFGTTFPQGITFVKDKGIESAVPRSFHQKFLYFEHNGGIAASGVKYPSTVHISVGKQNNRRFLRKRNISK